MGVGKGDTGRCPKALNLKTPFAGYCLWRSTGLYVAQILLKEMFNEHLTQIPHPHSVNPKP